MDDKYIGEYLQEKYTRTVGVQNYGKSRVFRVPVASLRAEQSVLRKQSLVGQRFTELLTAPAFASGAFAAQARVRQLVRRGGAARTGERTAARDCVRLRHAARDAILDQQVLGVWLCLSRTQRCRSY